MHRADITEKMGRETSNIYKATFYWETGLDNNRMKGIAWLGE